MRFQTFWGAVMAGCLCSDKTAGISGGSHVCIGSLWIFNDASPSEKSALAAAATRREYQKGERLFLQGEEADRMFLVKSGRVKITKVNKDGGEAILDTRKAGDFLGEQIFWDNCLYPGTAVCMQNSYICWFQRSSFQNFILQHPNIGLIVIRNLSKHIEQLNSRMELFSINDTKDRLYEYLINFCSECGEKRGNFIESSVDFSHEDLGFLLGAHRVSITRAMKLLIETGSIKKQDGKLLVRMN